MDLKSNDLFWPAASGQPPAFPVLRRDISCEVAIVGAGLSGALIAHELARDGIEVVLLDKRGIGLGSTSASTALIQYEIDVPLCELKAMRGAQPATRSYQICREAIGQLERTAGNLDNSCGFARRSSLYVARRPSDLAGLRREFTARREAGFKVEYLSARDLRKQCSLVALGAIHSEEAAEIDPFAFTRALVQSALTRGARVFAGVCARQIDASADRVVLRTEQGYAIAARRVIVAGGYESMAFLRFTPIRLRSTYALVTKPVADLSGWPDRSLIWEADRPYSYLRTTLDRRVMIGGEDEDFVSPKLRDALIGKKAQRLEKILRGMLPEIKVEPAFQWAGTFGDTSDGLPYIGTLPTSGRVLYALCYGANGTNFAMIAATLARD
jgi:glycine/D-amino acid oxidase-like deaminating enzyme